MTFCKKAFFPLLSCILFLGWSQSVHAQTIIRDTEIESDIAQWMAPVYAAAGLSADQVNIILVQDSQLNAFVAGGNNIFVFTGLLQKTENPGEVIGVLSHELGHLAGGHLIRGKEKMEQASYESILSVILGAGAAIATGNGDAFGAISVAGNSMAQRRFLSYSRTFESSADQAGLKFMEKAQINPTGLKTFLGKLESEELRPKSEQDAYVQTHPLTRDRIDALGARVQQSPYKDKTLPPAWTQQHKMMLAKLTGFITPQQVAWVYDDRDNSKESVTARAIAAYRTSDIQKALKLSDQLIAMDPNNPYNLELKGQMLVDFGRVKDSLPYYQKAVTLKPDAALIRTALAHAQIETAGNDNAVLNKAIQNLLIAQKSEPRSTWIHRLLATAYGRTGDESRAKLHLAEEALLQNKFNYAKSLAQESLKGLKSGSADWIRANDLLNYITSSKPELLEDDAGKDPG